MHYQPLLSYRFQFETNCKMLSLANINSECRGRGPETTRADFVLFSVFSVCSDRSTYLCTSQKKLQPITSIYTPVRILSR